MDQGGSQVTRMAIRSSLPMSGFLRFTVGEGYSIRPSSTVCRRLSCSEALWAMPAAGKIAGRNRLSAAM